MTDSSASLISIVLATFNGEKFIAAQLQSLFDQTYPNIEVIVVDDCSTDNTVQILNQYAEQHQALRVIVNENNLGYIKNFEKGMLFAKGEFIAPCDQDDVWLPDKLIKLMNNRGSSPIIYCNSSLIDANGRSLSQNLSDIKKLTTFTTPLNYAIGNSAPGHAMLIERRVVDQSMPLPSTIPHDYWLGFVATFSGSVTYFNESLIQYRQHQTNVFGVTKVKRRAVQVRKSKRSEEELARQRVKFLYEKCPDSLPEKKVLLALLQSYESFSIRNNFKRMFLFFAHGKEILAFKNRSMLRRWLYCVKMFTKIV